MRIYVRCDAVLRKTCLCTICLNATSKQALTVSLAIQFKLYIEDFSCLSLNSSQYMHNTLEQLLLFLFFLLFAIHSIASCEKAEQIHWIVWKSVIVAFVKWWSLEKEKKRKKKKKFLFKELWTRRKNCEEEIESNIAIFCVLW